MNTILKLEHIQKYYGNEGNITKAIKDISFSVEAGEFLGIMGASGSGKTTLLNCISTIDELQEASLKIPGSLSSHYHELVNLRLPIATLCF